MTSNTDMKFCGEPGAKSIRKGSVKVVLGCVLLCLVAPVRAGLPWLHVDGNRIKDPNGNVVVLRGVSLIDLGFLEGWQGGAINMIDRLTDKTDTQGTSPGWYTRAVRIPIAPPDTSSGWPHRWSADDDTFYNNLLRPVVDYCALKGLYVIIDWHYITDTFDKTAETSEFWEYMAPRFAGDSHVLFEIFNEPINRVGGDIDNWLSVRSDMQTWVDLVRTYAANNIILVAGPSWSQGIGPAASYPLSGSNIAIVSHIYPGHWRNPSWYQNHITTCAAVYPIVMTEWGFSQSNHPDPNDLLNGTITEYGQPLMDFIESLKIGNTAWVASYDWGPPMFLNDWTLRCGEGEMGCFVKDTLYAKRNDDQPGGQPPGQGPYGGLAWSIPGVIEAENYDTGGQNVAYYDTTGGNSGGAYRSDDVDIESCSEGGYNVGWVEAGEWLEYTVDVALTGIYDIRHRVASESAGGRLHIEFEGNDIAGPLSFAATGGWQSWTNVYANDVVLGAGEHVVRLSMDSAGWNINYIDFTMVGNFRDLAYFAAEWQKTGCDTENDFCYGADLDGSGDVSWPDLEMWTLDWLAGL